MDIDRCYTIPQSEDSQGGISPIGKVRKPFEIKLVGFVEVRLEPESEQMKNSPTGRPTNEQEGRTILQYGPYNEKL